MKLFTAPEKVFINHNDNKIFLAGSIDQGTADNWQNRIIDYLKNEKNIVLLNPRRKNWDPTWIQSIKNKQFKEQVMWELTGLDLANIIVFYFDGNSKSPITLLELGLYANNPFKNILVYCPKNFYRKGNVDIVCEVYNIKVIENEKYFLKSLKELIHNDYFNEY